MTRPPVDTAWSALLKLGHRSESQAVKRGCLRAERRTLALRDQSSPTRDMVPGTGLAPRQTWVCCGAHALLPAPSQAAFTCVLRATGACRIRAVRALRPALVGCGSPAMLPAEAPAPLQEHCHHWCEGGQRVDKAGRAVSSCSPALLSWDTVAGVACQSCAGPATRRSVAVSTRSCQHLHQRLCTALPSVSWEELVLAGILPWPRCGQRGRRWVGVACWRCLLA